MSKRWLRVFAKVACIVCFLYHEGSRQPSFSKGVLFSNLWGSLKIPPPQKHKSSGFWWSSPCPHLEFLSLPWMLNVFVWSESVVFQWSRCGLVSGWQSWLLCWCLRYFSEGGFYQKNTLRAKSFSCVAEVSCISVVLLSGFSKLSFLPNHVSCVAIFSWILVTFLLVQLKTRECRMSVLYELRANWVLVLLASL